jgi:hypothetical protein
MANEITIALNVQVLNGYMRSTFQPGQIQAEQSAVGRAGHAQSIGTSAEVVDLGDISANGLLILRNLDTTNYITYGPQEAGSGGDMVTFGKIKPGGVALTWLAPTVVLMAQADTAEALLDVYLYED